MPFKHPSAVRVTESKPAEEDRMLHFTAEKMVRAICFHLIDDAHAMRVDGPSIRSTRQRLERNGISAIVGRLQWATMSNRERLEWLLSRAKTSASYNGATAVLAQDR